MSENTKIEKTDEEDFIVPLDFTSLKNSVMSEVKAYLEDSSYRKYSREQIEQFLDNPQQSETQLREVSKYLASSSSYYMRLVLYMARMLTLDYIIIPYNISSEDVKTDGFRKNYNKIDNYMDTFNVKHELGKVLLTVMIEDTFFGYERRVKNSSMVQKLPSNYCKITGMEDGLFTFSFDMQYFNNDKKKLRNYPPEFAELYRIYEKTRENWQPLDTNYAVCFKFREDLTYGLPPFSGMFEDILDHQDLKELDKAKSKLENFKLLLQKIPFKKDPKSERDFLIGLDSVKMFHNNIKAVLPSQIGLISSPMEIEDFSFEKKNNAIGNTLKEKQEAIYSAAGVDADMFNSSGKSAIAMSKSTQTDEALMFGLLRQFERFFNRRLAQHSAKKYRFKVMFPDLTVYNRAEMFDKYMQSAQYGFPKTLVISALGMTTTELVSLNTFENDFLNLQEKLLPLASSHTQSGNDDVKREKSENELTEKGAETRDRGTNKETAAANL